MMPPSRATALPDAAELSVPSPMAGARLAQALRAANRARVPIALGAIGTLLVASHLLALYQGPNWTSPLLIGDRLFNLALALAILVYGLALGRKIAVPLRALDDDWLTGELAALGLGLGALSVAILCAGILHLYYGLLFLAGAIGLTRWLYADLRLITRQLSLAVARWRRAALGLRAGPRVLLIILVLAVIPLFVEGALPVGTTVMDWDAPAYHLAGPKLFMEAHRLLPLPDIPLANAPSGEEMLYLIGLAAGTDLLGKLLSVLFALLLGLAVYAFGRRHFASGVGIAGIFLLFNVNWLVPELPATLNDLAAAFLVVLGVSDVLSWITCRCTLPSPRAVDPNRPYHAARSRSQPERPGTDRLLIRGGMLLGLAASFKLVDAPAIPAIALGVTAACLVAGSGGLGRRAIRAVGAALLVGGSALIALSPWLLKGWYFFGNPLYPATVPTGVTAPGQAVPQTHDSLALLLPSNLFWAAQTLLGVFWQSLGPLSVLLLVGAFVLHRRAEQGALWFLLFGSALWLRFVPLYSDHRYYLSLTAIGAVLAAATMLALLEHNHALGTIVAALAIAYLAVHGVQVLSLSAQNMIQSRAIGVATGGISAQSYLAEHVKPYLAEDWVNHHTPSNATVALVHTTLGYYLDRPHLNDWYSTRRLRLDAGGQMLLIELAAWCKAGVRYVVFNRGDDHDRAFHLPLRVSTAWLQQPGLAAHLLFSANRVDVLALNPCGVRAAPSHALRAVAQGKSQR